ncbi:Glycogen recognition site of AMP-activated protein kinase [Dyadobacter soli]|jgi:1,4-alpha-glucan branching enzyme|uniref:Glycogen recognition site of AMP-activated protein kinase n=1 Tax=Dyadobacter soli TaxID=659014 RepID=A0A1G7BWS9_9BACT|nr:MULTISPECIES: isoamylase early set domain-containing protein [Dyadobacter]SDE31483.1 Glycogen recognition site of AMP-activated protein kinase [Dyadobacter soli]SEI68355.1 Glycogen recognition site of AMP-activated protein kinase [Dyadobacter sp. SG02]
MALAKQFVKSKSVFKVTFTVPAEAASDAKKIALVGEFNGWNPEEAIALKKQKDGSFKTSLELGAGEYQFRYILDGEKWENDWEADKYVPAGVDATENSVVVL